MKKFNFKSSLIKLSISALSVIGASTFVFNMGTEALAAAGLKTQDTVPTNYQVSPASEQTTPKGYQKADYNVILDSNCKDTPTANDLTMEEAAELGAQFVWEVYGVDLDNADIYMYYNSASESFPRSTWSGDIIIEGERKPGATRWTFDLDSVTGERFGACFGETIDEKVSLGVDSSLEKDFSVYAKLAQEVAERCNFVHGSVAEVTYNCQGYSNNNPDITLNVIGKNGEKALITFSRYNQKLLGVGLDTSLRISEEAFEEFYKQVEEASKAAKNKPAAKGSDSELVLESAIISCY